MVLYRLRRFLLWLVREEEGGVYLETPVAAMMIVVVCIAFITIFALLLATLYPDICPRWP